MQRALLIFVLGTKYTHPFSETQGLGSRGAGWARRLQDHTKGALRPRARPHSQALGSGVRPRPPSAPPLRVPAQLLRAPLLVRGRPENPERTGPGRRRMLSCEQVRLASRKLQRCTGGGGGGSGGGGGDGPGPGDGGAEGSGEAPQRRGKQAPSPH